MGILSTCADEMVLKLLHLDNQVSLLKDLVNTRAGPLRVAQRNFAAAFQFGSPAWTLLHHPTAVALSDSALSTHRRRCRSMALQLSSGVWHRCDLYFNTWPFRLMGLTCVTRTAEERRALAQEFLSTPTCCLDVGFSRQLRRWLLTQFPCGPTPEETREPHKSRATERRFIGTVSGSRQPDSGTGEEPRQSGVQSTVKKCQR